MKFKPMRTVEYIVVHCSATKEDQDFGASDIDRWHRQRGWTQIGYHYVIKRSGYLESGRPENMPGAHARGFNHKSIGICLIGGVGEDGKTPEASFTEEQLHTLTHLVKGLEFVYYQADVVGHRDLPRVRKGCPSFDVAHFFETGELIS